VALQNGIPWAALRMTSDAADETFNLEEVIGFSINTAAELFDQIVRALLKRRLGARERAPALGNG
jgi:nucleoside phosphorylase